MVPVSKILKKTPLADIHEKLDAQMVDFAGWYMPLRYRTLIEEHKTTRSAASLFDISHMGEIEIRGGHAFAYLQQLLTIDLLKLSPNRCMYSLLCYEHGGTVDDCFVYCYNSNRFWLVVNAANIVKDVTWLRDHAAKYSVTVRDLSPEKAKLDIQGPLSGEIAARLSPFPLTLLERFEFIETRLDGIPVMLSRTGYTGEDGFEIYFDCDNAEKVWNALLDADSRLKPAGLGARDTLRIEACYSLYGNELGEHISPIEAGIPWVVHDKKDDFIGKNILLSQKKQGTKRRLHAFRMEGRAVPRSGYEIHVEGKKAGFVSSGTFSPTFNQPLGLGFIEHQALMPGDEIEIVIREGKHRAIVMKRPFYHYRGGKN